MRKSAIRKIVAIGVGLNVALLWLWRRTGRPKTESPAPTPAEHPQAALHATPVEAAAAASDAVPAATKPQRIFVLALLVAALFFAVWGQSYFAEGQYSPNLPAGLALYVAAIAFFILAIGRSDRLTRERDDTTAVDPSRTGQASDDEDRLASFLSSLPGQVAASVQAARSQPRRVLALLAVALMTIVLLDLLQADPPLPDYTLPFLLWLAAIGLYFPAAVPKLPRARSSAKPWWRSDWPVAAALPIIVLVAFVLRAWHVESIPPTLAGDEGTFGLESVKTITGEWPHRNPFTTGWLSVPMLSFYFNSLTIRVFGQTVFALRLPWALVGVLTIPIVFQLVRRLTGTTLALMTAGLLAAYHFHIHYSRLGINNAADPLLIALVLYLLYRAVERRSLLDWALCGAAVGVAQYFYFGARLAIVIVGAMTVYFFVRGGIRFLRRHGRGVVIMVGAAIVAGAPMIQYAIRFPLDYNARFNQIGIIGPSGWLEREVVIRNQDAVTILLDQLQRAALAFNVYPDRTGWYGSPQPLFDFTTGILFLLGLGYATLRPGDRRLFPMVLWWWTATIIGGALTESPPSTQRLVTLGPPAVFFVALAVLKIGQVVQRVWDAWSPRQLVPYLATAVVAISAASVNWYFADFTPLRTYGTFNAVVATEMATYMRDQLGPDWRVYFFGAPRMYSDFGTIPYMVPEVERVDILEALTAPLDPGVVLPDKNAAFIFLPERRGELEWVRQTFPDGTLDEIPSFWEGDPNPFFVVYRAPVLPMH